MAIVEMPREPPPQPGPPEPEDLPPENPISVPRMIGPAGFCTASEAARKARQDLNTYKENPSGETQ